MQVIDNWTNAVLMFGVGILVGAAGMYATLAIAAAIVRWHDRKNYYARGWMDDGI